MTNNNLDNVFGLLKDTLPHDIGINHWSDVEELNLFHDVDNPTIYVQDKSYNSVFASDDDSSMAHSHHSLIMKECNKSMDVEKSSPLAIPVKVSAEKGYKLSECE